jgi:nitrate reductase / nitrite oxidoreductase, alpha subunit
MAQGFAADVHCVTGAPREAMAKFTKAEPGGYGRGGSVAAGGVGLPPDGRERAVPPYLEGGFMQP